jgi:hypothetical protein
MICVLGTEVAVSTQEVLKQVDIELELSSIRKEEAPVKNKGNSNASWNFCH